MNAWLVAGAALLAALVPLGVFAFRGPIADRLVAMELAGVLETLALLALAEGFDRDVYFDLAVVMGVLSFVGSLVYVRFLERWL
jgi:multicomponent Na+:H+ antiporter subunit F